MCHGDEGRADQPGEDGVLDFEHPFIWSQPCLAGSRPVVKKSRDRNRRGVARSRSSHRGLRIKQRKRHQRAADHDRGLDEIGPDDRLDSTERGVNRRQDDDHDRGADINPQSFRLAWPRAADHFVGERERDGRDIKPRAGGEQTRNHEDRGGSVLFATPKRAVRYS